MRCKNGTRRNKSGECIAKQQRRHKCPRGSRKKVKGGPCISRNKSIISQPPFITQYETKFERF